MDQALAVCASCTRSYAATERNLGRYFGTASEHHRLVRQYRRTQISAGWEHSACHWIWRQRDPGRHPAARDAAKDDGGPCFRVQYRCLGTRRGRAVVRRPEEYAAGTLACDRVGLCCTDMLSEQQWKGLFLGNDSIWTVCLTVPGCLAVGHEADTCFHALGRFAISGILCVVCGEGSSQSCWSEVEEAKCAFARASWWRKKLHDLVRGLFDAWSHLRSVLFPPWLVRWKDRT